MCFYITDGCLGKTAEIKAKKESIYAYKLLDSDYYSPFWNNHPWIIGEEQKSDRNNIQLTPMEQEDKTINLGIHLYLYPPNPRPFPCPHSCLNLTQCPCQYICPEGRGHWVKVQVETKHLVMINDTELVCLSCTPVEDISEGEME